MKLLGSNVTSKKQLEQAPDVVYIAAAPAATYAEEAADFEYIASGPAPAPAPALTYAAAPLDEFVAPTPIVACAALAPVAEMRDIIETDEKRSNLESYIINRRNKVAESAEYGILILPTDREEFIEEVSRSPRRWTNCTDSLEVKKATYIEELDGLPAVSEVTETPETYPTDEANGDVPMQDQTKNGKGDWKKEAQSAPKEPKKKYDWFGVVKKCKRTKWKRTDVAATTSGTLGLAAHALPKRRQRCVTQNAGPRTMSTCHVR